MKKNGILLSILMLTGLFTGCDNDIVYEEPITGPSSQEFGALKAAAYNNHIQEFTFDANDEVVTFTSDEGVIITYDTSCLTKDGEPVTGGFTIEYVEFFDKGDMLTADRATMGKTSNGYLRMLLSGGEIFMKLVQDDEELDSECGYSVSIPVELTGGEDEDMEPFTGSFQNGGLVWTPEPLEFWIGTNEEDDTVYYNAIVEDFDWFSCAKFADFDREMININAYVPEGYNASNCNIYVSVRGEKHGLGTLSGQYPIGLECHLIFVTVNNGNWSYSMKSVTLEDIAYTFAESDLTNTNESALSSLITNMP